MRRTTVAVVLAGLLTACASGPAEHPAPTPSTARAESGHERAVRATARTVQHYLDEWADRGPAAASRLLVPGMRVTTDRGMPILDQGRVTSAEMRWWRDPEHYTVLVTMDLRFDGSPFAWDRGSNTRFVKVHGPRRLLSLASGP